MVSLELRLGGVFFYALAAVAFVVAIGVVKDYPKGAIYTPAEGTIIVP